MKKIISLSIILLFIGVNSLFAEVLEGQKIYSKHLQPQCKNMSATNFAAKHSQDEWEEIYDAGELNSEIKVICNHKTVDEKFLPHIYDFVYEYANDSAKIPTKK